MQVFVLNDEHILSQLNETNRMAYKKTFKRIIKSYFQYFKVINGTYKKTLKVNKEQSIQQSTCLTILSKNNELFFRIHFFYSPSNS